jgi:hypothetical protein
VIKSGWYPDGLGVVAVSRLFSGLGKYGLHGVVWKKYCIGSHMMFYCFGQCLYCWIRMNSECFVNSSGLLVNGEWSCAKIRIVT